MASYLLTYDLRKARDYEALYEQLKEWDAVALLESVWLFDYVGSSGTIRDHLKTLMDGDDGLAVIQLVPPFGWATRHVTAEANSWLTARAT